MGKKHVSYSMIRSAAFPATSGTLTLEMLCRFYDSIAASPNSDDPDCRPYLDAGTYDTASEEYKRYFQRLGSEGIPL